MRGLMLVLVWLAGIGFGILSYEGFAWKSRAWEAFEQGAHITALHHRCTGLYPSMALREYVYYRGRNALPQTCDKLGAGESR